jgi:peptide/nickel transport system permease protein
MSGSASPPPSDGPALAPPPPLPRPRWRETAGEAYRTLRANLLTAFGFFLVVAIVLLAIIVAVLPALSMALIGHTATIVPYDPNALSSTILQGPSWVPWLLNPGGWLHGPPNLSHLLGTDELGRDEFSRILVALPLDLWIGFVITGLAILIGGGLGLVAGFWDGPGWLSRATSAVILRVTDVFLAFPTLVLAFALAAILGRNLNATLIALTVTWWPYYVRLVRGEVLTIKHQGYIAAARIAGASEPRILVRHVLRNLLEPLTVYGTLDIGTVLVTFSTISYFGISVAPTTPEWGSMIEQGQSFLPQFLYLVLAPGAAIFITVLGFSLLGDGMRDVLDPRTRRAFARATRPETAPHPTVPPGSDEAS